MVAASGSYKVGDGDGDRDGDGDGDGDGGSPTSGYVCPSTALTSLVSLT